MWLKFSLSEYEWTTFNSFHKRYVEVKIDDVANGVDFKIGANGQPYYESGSWEIYVYYLFNSLKV